MPEALAKDRHRSGSKLAGHLASCLNPPVMSAFRGRSYQALPEQGDAEDAELRQFHPAHQEQYDQPAGHRGFHFSAKSQLVRLLRPSLTRWLVSLLLSTGFVFLLRYYARQPSLEQGSQARFLIASSVVLLALAANVQFAFMLAGNQLRWRLLAQERHSAYQMDALLSIGFVGGAAKYALRRKSMKSTLASLVWIGFYLGMCFTVCLTGFFYSFDQGTTGDTVSGTVLLADLKHFYYSTSTSDNPSIDSEYLAAHVYGEASYPYLETSASAAQWGHQPPLVDEWQQEEKGWRYFFRESNADRTAASTSSRSVKVSAKCAHYDIVEGQNGDLDTITYVNGTERKTLINLQRARPGATVWSNTLSTDDPSIYCGPRCASVVVIQYLDVNEPRTNPGQFFDCKITVSSVDSSTLPAHELKDGQAIIAAGAIGLRGFVDADRWQYVRYPRDIIWGQKFESNTTRVEWLSSRFAAGSLAMLDLLNPKVEAQGSVPKSGTLLVPHWMFIIVSFGSLLLLQFVLAVGSAVYSSSVISPPDSPLILVSMLRGVANKLTPYGLLLTAQDISRALRWERYVYGVREADGKMMQGNYRVEVGQDLTPSKHFPNGRYD
ncbi:hypothetical protein CPB86DRAFT_806652 [Serendipita vermifera]|nr:hypothetical protein CPB86DRAFT_806652 [Serendipita vermifera]